MIKKYLTLILLVCSSPLWANEWSGNVSFEYKGFTKEALYPTQLQQYGSVSFQPEWFHEWENGKQSFTFVPFTRLDQRDDQRTHSDIRELSWLKVFAESELRVGIRKVYWGVSESQHLVDVINQTDLVESIDGEEKLGQPMINYAFINDWGTVDLFVLPYFRERTFPGKKSRLRTSYIVDTGNPIYESKDKQNNVDYALRWSHSIGDWDIGLSHFNGTSRDPYYVVGVDANSNTVFRPEYNLMQQTGLDLQVTKEDWLWKLEAINRRIKGGVYNAVTAGFEYTFYSLFDSSSDVGLVMEYLYDSRGNKALTPFADDIMLGLRWTNNDENDTTFLFGVIADRIESSRLYSIEGSRRIGESWKLIIEARLFEGISSSDIYTYPFRQDDFFQVELAYYF